MWSVKWSCFCGSFSGLFNATPLNLMNVRRSTQRAARDSCWRLMEFFPPLFRVWKVRTVFITGSYFCPWRIRVSLSKCTRITLTSRSCLTETFATWFWGKFGILLGRWSQGEYTIKTLKKHTCFCFLNKHMCFFHFASQVAINTARNLHILHCQTMPAFNGFINLTYTGEVSFLMFNEQKLV